MEDPWRWYWELGARPDSRMVPLLLDANNWQRITEFLKNRGGLKKGGLYHRELVALTEAQGRLGLLTQCFFGWCFCLQVCICDILILSYLLSPWCLLKVHGFAPEVRRYSFLGGGFRKQLGLVGDVFGECFGRTHFSPKKDALLRKLRVMLTLAFWLACSGNISNYQCHNNHFQNESAQNIRIKKATSKVSTYHKIYQNSIESYKILIFIWCWRHRTHSWSITPRFCWKVPPCRRREGDGLKCEAPDGPKTRQKTLGIRPFSKRIPTSGRSSFAICQWCLYIIAHDVLKHAPKFIEHDHKNQI